LIIFGSDPGFAFLGIGIIELLPTSTRVLHHETFITRSKDDDHDRLDAIAEHYLDLLDQYDVAALGYENQAGVEVAAHRPRTGGEEDVWTNSSSRRVHEVTGIIRCAARCFDLPVYCLAPSTIKVGILGKGGTKQKGKEPVKNRVRSIFGIECSEHAGDAIACAITTGVRHRRHLATLQAHAALIH
jgi:Holliday junction resolvasome RuvABC endonuclease subunit